jgi:hypothetical protein
MWFVHVTDHPDRQSHLGSSIEPGASLVVADEPDRSPHTLAERGSPRYDH